MGVYETRDAGANGRPGRAACRREHAYLTVLRQAFDADAGSPPSLYFGATSGDVFGSADGGELVRRSDANRAGELGAHQRLTARSTAGMAKVW